MATPLVAIRGLTKAYTRGHETVEVLHGIDLEIADGDLEAAEKEAAQAVMSNIEEALSAVFGNVPMHKIYAAKKANKKKTNPGGK